jgi:protein-L-isoaspartate O-methyltransferase
MIEVRDRPGATYFESFGFDSLQREIEWQIHQYARHPWLVVKYRIALSLPQECRVLDLGCGIGDFLAVVSEIRPLGRLYGVDREDSLRYIAKDRIAFVQCDIGKGQLPLEEN